MSEISTAGFTGKDQILRRAQAARTLGGKCLDQSSHYFAESAGLLWAIDHNEPVIFNDDPTIQRSFLRGFLDGREMMKAATAGQLVGQA